MKRAFTTAPLHLHGTILETARAPFDETIPSARRPIRVATVINLLIIPRGDGKRQAGIARHGAERSGAQRSGAAGRVLSLARMP